jgi:hypothetical protein
MAIKGDPREDSTERPHGLVGAAGTTENERVSAMVPSERDAQDVPHVIVNSDPLRRIKGVLAALIIAIVAGVIIALVVI